MRLVVTAAVFVLVASQALATGAANPDATAVAAGKYAVEPKHTRIQFSVSHMGFTEWYGDFAGASGTLRLDPKRLETAKLEINIPTASVTTTNTTLDGELKSADWFDAARFPNIHFVATKIERTAADRAAITGDLTVHGVTRPAVLDARFNGAGINPLTKAYTIGFNATTTIKRSDFGVRADMAFIGDEVTLRISAAFEKTG